jgi:hypothetical protein
VRKLVKHSTMTMLQELIDVTRSVEFEESEGWLYVESVEWKSASELSLLLTLCCDEQQPQVWRVSCDHVLAQRFVTRRYGSLALTSISAADRLMRLQSLGHS